MIDGMKVPVPDVHFRLATRSDLPAILELLRADSMTGAREHPAHPDSYESGFDNIASHPDNDLYVGILDNELIATMQITYIPGLGYGGAWRAQVEGVRVRTDLRGKGIGAHLMQFVIKRARERQCSLIQLTTNQRRVDAQRFYRRLGFEGTHLGMKLFL